MGAREAPGAHARCVTDSVKPHSAGVPSIRAYDGLMPLDDEGRRGPPPPPAQEGESVLDLRRAGRWHSPRGAGGAVCPYGGGSPPQTGPGRLGARYTHTIVPVVYCIHRHTSSLQ